MGKVKAPERWPDGVELAVERLMRSAVGYLREYLTQLEATWRQEKGVELDWESPEARAWIVRRLEERLFG